MSSASGFITSGWILVLLLSLLFSSLPSVNSLVVHPSTSTARLLAKPAVGSRRDWLTSSTAAALSLLLVPEQARAAEEEQETYDNPNIPAGPEERSGLVILRVAEVAQFQEKILRAVCKGDLEAVVSPMQIAFGTQILLKNSNLDGNMKLMIYNEIPKKKRKEAIQNAVETMNTLQDIYSTAAAIDHPFEKEEMLYIADLYLKVRLQLNNMYEYLPDQEKNKYYGYFMAVTEYEKKIANGTYNPDIDGILKFDD